MDGCFPHLLQLIPRPGPLYLGVFPALALVPGLAAPHIHTGPPYPAQSQTLTWTLHAWTRPQLCRDALVTLLRHPQTAVFPSPSCTDDSSPDPPDSFQAGLFRKGREEKEEETKVPYFYLWQSPQEPEES